MEPIYDVPLPIGIIVELILKGQLAKDDLTVGVQYMVDNYIKEHHIVARHDASKIELKL